VLWCIEVGGKMVDGDGDGVLAGERAGLFVW
jgi:hypothetical protein